MAKKSSGKKNTKNASAKQPKKRKYQPPSISLEGNLRTFGSMCT